MFLKEYNVSEVFISKLGYYSEEHNRFIYYPTYGFEFSLVVNKEDNWYTDIKDNTRYKSYKGSNSKEKKYCSFWGELIPIWSYLTAEEKEKGKITSRRISEIYYEINSIRVLKPETKKDNVLTFRLKKPY